MGYTTDFVGKFKLNKKLDEETYTFLRRFNETRRMRLNVAPEYGIDGEFYIGHHEDFDDGAPFGQIDRRDRRIIDYNDQPKTQPGLWCQWRPSDCGNYIEWDEGEKFYSYIEWLQYIITNFLAPKGYLVSGEVKWYGEDREDQGVIIVENNKIRALTTDEQIRDLKTENARLRFLIPDAILLSDED